MDDTSVEIVLLTLNIHYVVVRDPIVKLSDVLDSRVISDSVQLEY